MDKKLKKMLISLASLGTVLTASQAKSGTFNYESATTLGEIRDMSLSSENKMFALKTSGAKIGDMELPVWVGNTDNLRGAFSAPWMTNAVASCAFFKDRLYVAPKGETNCLYRVDVGTNEIPHVKSAEAVFQTSQAMNEPYLYATENNLYAIENNGNNGIKVHAFNENGPVSSQEVNNENGASIRKEQIKDIVSKDDNLYILTTNGAETANLWLYNGTNNGCITPNEWITPSAPAELTPELLEEINLYQEMDFSREEALALVLSNHGLGVTPLFDKTTTIAVHGDDLLTANSNLDNGTQYGFKYPIGSNGILGSGTPYIPSRQMRVSAIGSDQQDYYAEEINEQDTTLDIKDSNKCFVKANQPAVQGEDVYVKYEDNSSSRQGEPVHKLTTQKQGEIFGIAKDRLYRIKNNNSR